MSLKDSHSRDVRNKYGTLPTEETYSESHAVNTSRLSRNRLIFVAVGLICASLYLCATVKSSGQGAELIFYEHKYTELDPSGNDGGDWMHCMRCRKESPECHSPDPDVSLGAPARSTWGYTLPSKDARTNACPPRPGMVTVQVRRNGIVRVEWFDKVLYITTPILS